MASIGIDTFFAWNAAARRDSRLHAKDEAAALVAKRFEQIEQARETQGYLRIACQRGEEGCLRHGRDLRVRLGDRITLTTVALALVFAGALGNVHDRIVYGSVVDFIEVHIFSYHWPDFNLADSSIVIGACLLVLDSLRPKKSANTQHLSS